MEKTADQNQTMMRLTQKTLSEEKIQALALKHNLNEAFPTFKPRANPFSQIPPKRLSDMFVDPVLKKEFASIEKDWKDRGLPLTMAELPFEKVKQITGFIDE